MRPPFQLSAVIAGEIVEWEMPPASDILAALQRGDVWGEACLCPNTVDFPRANVSFHQGYGFVMQCYEDEESRSDFLAASDGLSAPAVPIALGGQAVELWPPELFVPESLVKEALEWFLNSGTQKRDLHWIRIDRFPREVVWEGREGREAWEEAQGLVDGDETQPVSSWRRPLPSEPVAWLREIASAYLDARETIPFGELIGLTIEEDTLFHLGPSICLKMRGLPQSGAPMKKASDAALASYVATTEQEPWLRQDPLLGFAFAYLASHLGLDLLDTDEVGAIMEFVEQHREDLARLVDTAT